MDSLCLLLTAHCSLIKEVFMGEFLLELWSFMKERKKFWLLPIIICLVLLGSWWFLLQALPSHLSFIPYFS